MSDDAVSPPAGTPAPKDLISLDGQFYVVREIQPSLDGDLVVADASSPAALAANGTTTVTCKAAELKPAGEVAGTTIWGR